MFHRYLDNESSLHSLKSPAPRAWPELGRPISRGQQPLTADTAATGARSWGEAGLYRVSSKTVCTYSLFVNCAFHAGPIIKWSIYFFSWIKIDAKNGITLKN